jgi:putative Mg2+ transporter-C (MgtC) family protein
VNRVLDSIIPIVVAYLLALPLAFERNARAETDIGLRTVPLVSVGACGYMLISRFLLEAGIFNVDGLSRTLRAVMTGIGFIGGGAIVKHAKDVQGLATGASVWSAGAIGASIAFGQYMTAVVLALSNVIILEIQRRLERRHLEP